MPHRSPFALLALAVLAAPAAVLPAAAEPGSPGAGDSGIPLVPEDATRKKFTRTESGLEYRILRAGKGDRPKAASRVEVHYEGWLDDQTVFASSYTRKQTATFGLEQVIAGWTEGLQLVREGGMIELRIPAKLAYGDRGVPPKVPGGARLHFRVELIAIRP